MSYPRFSSYFPRDGWRHELEHESSSESDFDDIYNPEVYIWNESFCQRRDATRWVLYAATYDFFTVSDVRRLAPAEIGSYYALREFLQAERRTITEQQENLYFWWLQFDPSY